VSLRCWGHAAVHSAGNEGPAITWQDAVQIDWGVVLLYGGGFALGVLSFQTGLAEAMGRGLTGLLPIQGSLGLLTASVLVAVILSETTSNTAAANMVVPVVISVARAAGLDPFEPALGATLAASLASCSQSPLLARDRVRLGLHPAGSD